MPSAAKGGSGNLQNEEYVFAEGEWVRCVYNDGEPWKNNYTLITYLNEFVDSPVSRVLDIVQRANACVNPIDADKILAGELEPILSSIHGSPRLGPIANSVKSLRDLVWTVIPPVETGGQRSRRSTAQADVVDEIQFLLIEEICHLASRGKIELIRRCTTCNKWMRARQQNQSFCSTYCRQKAFEIDPLIRERRNAARRESYQREVKADKERRMQNLQRRSRYPGSKRSGGAKR